jgi:hypothetical protein
MENNLFSRFAPLLGSITESQLAAACDQPQGFLIDSGNFKGKQIEVAYAPFDFVNHSAQIVIVGLTPGRQQMRNALLEARRSLRAGRSEQEAMSDAKIFASFSGPMRSNLISMLDSMKINQLLGISSTATLWKEHSEKVHFTSALRYPVFVDGKNYSGSPAIVSTPILRSQLMNWFASEMSILKNAFFVPLGPKVAEAVQTVASHLNIDSNKILSGLPHPSGANSERIAYFLGRKHRDQLSSKVEPERICAAREELEIKISQLRVAGGSCHD